MARDTNKVPKASVISLVRGIIDDAKQLVLGHYELRKYEALQRVARVKSVAIWLGIGVAFVATGGFLVIIMVVHLLHDFANLPLWGSYGIVAIVLIAVAGVLLAKAKKLGGKIWVSGDGD
jgi:Putative Actinobacterial Holin-X, holin superfamily III